MSNSLFCSKTLAIFFLTPLHIAFVKKNSAAILTSMHSYGVLHKISPTPRSKHHTTHTVLTAIFPGEPGLAGCPLNFPSSFILELSILLEQA